ncbi:MAG: hypothetical protein JSW41_00190 [Candidatus Aenigmatarchaeota archaeon]|nr:MAG: hypothetical protein JSW41_00190 [Candidatus Aenigmarchaeota archaeon]
MKTIHILGIVVILLVVSTITLVGLQPSGQVVNNNSTCEFGQLNYYFRSDCSHCIQVSNDGSLEKLQAEFGVNVNKFEVVEWGMYGIYATPTFEFGGQRVRGYRTFDQIKELLGC